MSSTVGVAHRRRLAGPDLDAWAAEVEGLEVFAVPADEALPIAIDVVHENV